MIQQYSLKRKFTIRRQSPDINEINDAINSIKSAKRPMIIAGGGVQYSKATEQLKLPKNIKHQLSSIAGRANLKNEHPQHWPIGVTDDRQIIQSKC